MCDLFGRGFILLDKVLRKISYPYHKWLADDFMDFNQKLSLLQKYWSNLNLSQTPKFYALTKYIYDQIAKAIPLYLANLIHPVSNIISLVLKNR